MSVEIGTRIRYPDSVSPHTTDGRDIDTEMANLSGEGAQQKAQLEDQRLVELTPQPWDQVPSVEGDTYYDRPMLKASVWTVDIPLYYFLGGAAGAAMTLGAAMQLAAHGGKRKKELKKLSQRCHWIGIIGSTAGAALLIHDLGRPMRFVYMLRVFRPTSPMNMGSWILAGAAPTAIATGLLINRGGFLGRIGEVSGYISGIFGAALAGYTGVLVSNTAIPIWQTSRRWMPVLFIGSAAATTASILDLFADGKAARSVTRVFGAAGRLVELAAAKRVEHLCDAIPKVGEPFHHGGPSVLWKAAEVLTTASLVISLLPGKSMKKRRAAGVLGAAGSLCLRLAVHYLGNVSARDPRSSFQQQRARM
jgi:formate-dependent nitrite reductase membrane component NrfD